MKTRITILCVVCAATALVSLLRDRTTETQAQTQPPQLTMPEIENMRRPIDAFFEAISDPDKDSAAAVNDLLANSALSADEQTKTKVTEGVKQMNQHFGAYVSFEQIGVKKLGADLVVFRYVYKCQNYPVVWYFTYYFPRSKSTDPSTTPSSEQWRLIGFRYDTNLDAALLDATFQN
ncbi:MAG: hypothetical protein IJU03_01690 [Thermoguttaceae bacterium]|nr:hypothetical protein [Thermoguttaceae bacterium]